jgi:hypothetical protein
MQDEANAKLVPTKWKEDVAKALADAGGDPKVLSTAQREMAVPQNPVEVDYWTRQYLNDAKNWAAIAPNKGLAEAVRQRASQIGFNVNQLDASIRDTAQFAHSVKPHIDQAVDIVNQISDDKLGALAGRWNEFLAGKYGEADPQFIKLRDNLNLIDSAVARIHGGARGGGSVPMIDYMHSMLAAAPQNRGGIKASLSTFRNWVDGYESMAPGIASPTGGPPGLAGSTGYGTQPKTTQTPAATPPAAPTTPTPAAPTTGKTAPAAGKRWQVNGREIVPKKDGWYYVDDGTKVK